MSLLCAISVFGVESFLVVQGGVKKTVFCYFIREAVENFLKKHKGLAAKDLLLIYDNARAHVENFGGWWCRQLPGVKLSIAPNTPEFSNLIRLVLIF